MSIAKAKLEFVAPMLALAVAKLPEGSAWSYELNSMVNRTICVKARGKVHLQSRNGKNFTARCASIPRALERSPDDTVIDGEIVAHGEDGLPSFNVRPNHRGGGPEPNFYSFDLLTLRGRDPSSCARRSILLDAFALPGRRNEVRTMLVEIYTPVRFLRLMIVWTQ